MQVLLVSAKDGLMARLQLQGGATKAETDDFNLMAFGRVSKVRYCSTPNTFMPACACFAAFECCGCRQICNECPFMSGRPAMLTCIG